jgi:hypothetical protein
MDQPLIVFALEPTAPPLRFLRTELRAAGYPVGIGVGIAGEATETELDAPDWEAAFLRWAEPETHEVALVERSVRGEEEEADILIAQATQFAAARPESAGRLIIEDHLRRTQVVYAWQILPALLADDDHPAWDALDVALRALAERTEGIIYAEAEGFYDADGELLLAEDETAEALDLTFDWTQEMDGTPESA